MTPPSVVDDALRDYDGVGGTSYSDIVRAEVAERGPVFRFTLDFAGALPDRVANDENLIAGIGLTGADGSTLAMIVQGTRDGWEAGLQGEGTEGGLESWEIEGSRVTWSVAREHVDALGASFTWGASLKLLQFGDEVRQAGDKAPEAGPMTYPATKGRG